jgi:hypothetical protein
MRAGAPASAVCARSLIGGPTAALISGSLSTKFSFLPVNTRERRLFVLVAISLNRTVCH